MKKLLSLIIVGIIVVQSCMSTITIYANDTNDYIYRYSGVTHSNGYNVTCTLVVTQIYEDRFRGTFSAEGISIYSFSNKPIYGNVVFGKDLLTFVFQVRFYNDRYYSNIYATISPYEGVADCFCAGSWHLEDFKMTGEKQLRKEYSSSINMPNYNEDDMKFCMELSKAAYSTTFSKLIPDEIIAISKLNNFNTNDLIKSNSHRGRGEENNISYTILPNFSKDDNSVDLYVILRGTTEEEWQGNMDITGEEFTDVNQHQSFLNGSEYLKNKINQYFDINYEYYKNLRVNLYVTGHSRGAAVANLYAKYISDNRNLGTIDENLFANSVTAYTFATPNVEKYHHAMSNYYNIFNFCFYEDFVPTIPLTMPTEGWDYWKYGYTYWVSLSDLRKEQPNSNISLINKNNVVEVHNTMKKWNTVEKYYKEPCYNFDNVFSITAYDFFHNSFAKAMMPSIKNKFIGFYSLYADFKQFPDFVPLILVSGKNISTIITSHNYSTYNEIISLYGSSCFSYCAYETYKNIFSSINYRVENEINTYTASNNDITYYNQDELLSLCVFANIDNNLSILGWDLDDPSTWEGVTWNDDGNVESIDFSFKDLTGALDLSDFSSLTSVDITGNNLTSVNLDNCSSLEEIDCSFNKLTSLDLSDCTSLTSITCCYNYLDTHEGGTLYNALDDLMFGDCYVNYYPQAVPENATFNTTELNALKTFANTDNNESVLDWLDDDGNIDTDKLQNNVLFEYDGSNYRVVAIDVSESDVSGALNLTSFAQLQELYCENTGLTSLNVNGCTKLETLQCDGSRLTAITLPSNANSKTSSLYNVSCEYNYLDTSIFTQDIVSYVEFKAGGKILYENQKGDSAPLQSVLTFANTINGEDYSASTYSVLQEFLDECNCYDFGNLYLSQSEIDQLTTEFLTTIYNLKAYFDVKVSAPNGSLSIAYDDEVSNDSGTYSVLYGTTITLNATADNNCTFVGWYDNATNRYLSKNEQYSFVADSNANLKAVIIPNGSATLTFASSSNWIASDVTKTTAQWAELTTIEELLPDVPYRYGYSNGRWEYTEDEVLSLLQSGQDVAIQPVYDEGGAELPTPREATDEPLLDLYYNYDNDNSVGTFVMAAGFPDGIQVQSMGVAYYYSNACVFDPTEYTLLLNKDVTISRFNPDTLYDVYILNISNMTDRYNWAVRGYVSYFDTAGHLKTVYSNQINIVGTKDVDSISEDGNGLPPDYLD
ncbi:MAG: hypothetical protein ACI4IN_01950 [Eubacterium sp.]